MTSEAFLSLELEKFLLTIERITFTFSSVLNIAGLFCLIRVPTQHQSQMRTYLILIQITVIFTDIYLAVLFEPFPVLQAFAGYCVGLLCRVLQPTIVVFVYYSLVNVMGSVISLAIIHRHQTIVMRGRWALSEVARSYLRRLIVLLYNGPCLLFLAIPFDSNKSQQLIEHSVPDVRWMRERGSCFMLERNLTTMAILGCACFHFVLCLIIPSCAFLHTFIYLKGEIGKSAALKRTIESSLVKFFIQLNVPVLYIVLPVGVLLLETIFDCFSFEFCLLTASVIPLHPIVHNAILILIVPEYRTYFLNKLSMILTERSEEVIILKPSIATLEAAIPMKRRATIAW